MSFTLRLHGAAARAGMGLGLASIGRPGYLNLGHGVDLGPDKTPEALQARAHELLDTAHDLGVRYVDAARSYGLAERFTGAWLASRPAAAATMTVGSKWGYAYTAAWRVDAEQHEVKDHSVAQLRRQWPETVAELGRPPELYQIHSVTPDGQVLDDDEVLEELAGLRERGTRVGLSTSGPEQGAVILQALDVEVGGRRLFDSVQATWNVLERSAEGALALAHDAGLAVIVKEAVANGRLTRRGDPDTWGPLAAFGAREGVDADGVAIAAAACRPWADVVLSGATSPAQLASNMAAARLQVSDEDLEAWGDLVETSQAYWRRRSRLRWT